MSEPWAGHPKLVAWFDDLEDAVTTAFFLSEEQRKSVKALRVPRDHTWVMLARDQASRDEIREVLRDASRTRAVPIAADCNVLEWRDDMLESDTFENANGFDYVDVEYIEEGSAEELRMELISDAEDYAASEETGWFYTAADQEQDADPEDPS